MLNYSSLSLEFVDALTSAHSHTAAAAAVAEPLSAALRLNATCVISVTPLVAGPGSPQSVVQSHIECVLALPAASPSGRYRVRAAFCVRLNAAGGSGSGSANVSEDKCGEAVSLPIRIDTVDRSNPTGAPTNQPPLLPPSNADSDALAWLLGPGLVLWIALLILLAVCCRPAAVVFSNLALIF